MQKQCHQFFAPNTLALFRNMFKEDFTIMLQTLEGPLAYPTSHLGDSTMVKRREHCYRTKLWGNGGNQCSLAIKSIGKTFMYM